MTTVLITGINGRLAALVAGVLAGRSGVYVVGVDRELPAAPPAGVDLHLSDLRGSSLQELLRSTGAAVVVHLAQVGEERPAPGRETTVQGNVITTMELCGACVAAGVRRAVLRSSTLVYGARHDLPAFATESTPLSATGLSGLLHNYVEIERFAVEFSGKHPGFAATVLRCAGIAGAAAGSALARYLGQPRPPTLLGFDPRIQVLHPDDAAEAFALAALADDIDGPLNVAADGPLTLSHAIRLAGRQPLPLPGALFKVSGLLGGLPRAGALPFDVEFLRYSCIADTRRARDVLGWEPRRTAEEALRELAEQPVTAASA